MAAVSNVNLTIQEGEQLTLLDRQVDIAYRRHVAEAFGDVFELYLHGAGPLSRVKVSSSS
jgi:hypothetical protein